MRSGPLKNLFQCGAITNARGVLWPLAQTVPEISRGAKSKM
jgi:hypothetical protein